MSLDFKPTFDGFFRDETFVGDFTFRNSPASIRRFPFPFDRDEYMYSVNIEPHVPVAGRLPSVIPKDNNTPIGMRYGWGNQLTPFDIGQTARRQHLYLIGKTGTGKSTLLALVALPVAMAALSGQMADTARAIAETLNGELKDEQRSVMTRQTLEHCRQRIRDFERTRLFRRPPRH